MQKITCKFNRLSLKSFIQLRGEVPTIEVTARWSAYSFDKLRGEVPTCARWSAYFSGWSARWSAYPTLYLSTSWFYTFAPWKVIWGEQKDFCATVVSGHDVPLIGSRPFVPDHKIFFVDFQEADPAYFLCGILNSNLAKEFVDSHNISIQIGDIFKHMNLPSYDRTDQHHGKLVRLTKQAHDEADPEKREGIFDKLRELGDRILEDQ